MDSETVFPGYSLKKSLKSERCHWPNPEKSTGEQYQNAKLGRHECWEAVGEARQKFEEIASEIKTYLDKCSDPVAHTVVWTVYMIGRSRKESAPTIMFCGRDKNACNKVKETIKKSRIMEKYPEFRTRSRTEEFRRYARRKVRPNAKRNAKRKRRQPTVRTCSGSPAEVVSPLLHPLSDASSETALLHDQPHTTTYGHDQEFYNVTEIVEYCQRPHIGDAAGAGKAILHSPPDTRSQTPIPHDQLHLATYDHDQEFCNLLEGVKDRQQTYIGTAIAAGKAIIHSPPDTRSETPTLHDRPHTVTFGHGQKSCDIKEGVEDGQKTHIGTAVGAGKAILYSPSDTGPGMRIIIQGFHNDSSPLRPTTAGGFICHRGSIFLTTVAHAFHEDVNASPSTPEDYDIEFEPDDDSEEEDEEEHHTDPPSRCSVSLAPSELNDSTISISGRTFSDTASEFEQSSTIFSPTDHIINTSGANPFPAGNPMVRAQTRESAPLVKSDDLLLPVGEHIILSTPGSRAGLDYCLIEIEANELLKSKQIPLKLDQSLHPVPSGVVMTEPRDVDVVAATGSGGLLEGKLSGTPSFLMLPGSRVIQEVWTVRHGTEVFNGDCGAWVVDALNGDLFGHVVGGSPSLGVSYIVPAHFMFDDLKDRFDGEWKPAGESKFRRSWYIRSMQSERVKFVVGASTFEVPHDLLVHCSTKFKFLTTPKDPGREIALPDVTNSTFEDFLIWLYAYEQNLETENIDNAFHLAIFAQKYQIYDLRNQASDLIRAALRDRHWVITPDALLAVYKVAPSGSSLRQLCFLGFASMEGRHSLLDWKAAFLECPSIGWDYFQYKRDREIYYGQIETGGACRFHDHSNVGGWEPQDVICCPYSFQTGSS